MGGDDDRHCHGHRAGGAGYLRPGAPEYRREEAHRDRSVYAGKRPQTGRYAEGQSHGQPHHCRSDAAKDVPTESLEAIAHVDAPGVGEWESFGA